MVEVTGQLIAVEQGALLRALPELSTLRVTGSERQSWLAGMVTADISSLGAGRGAYALHVTKAGRVQADLWVLNAPEQILVGVEASRIDELRTALDRYLIMEDAEIEVAAEPLHWWLAHGPKAAAVAAIAREHGAITANGWLGAVATAMIVLPDSSGPNIAEALTRDGDVMLATPAGWNRVRIERLLPLMGVDFEQGSYPQEAALERLAVSFDKGCYVGQEVVFKLQKRGHVRSRLVRLSIDSESGTAAVGQAVWEPTGKEVGRVTSAAAADDHTIALAMVAYEHTRHGSALTVGGAPASVSCPSGGEQAAASAPG